MLYDVDFTKVCCHTNINPAPKICWALLLFVAFLLRPRSPGMVVLQLLLAGKDPSPTARNNEKPRPCETIIDYPQIHKIPSLLVHLEEWHLDQCKRHFALVLGRFKCFFRGRV